MEEVSKIVGDLSVRKVDGRLDGIPGRLLKASMPHTAASLTHVFNTSHRHGEFS